MTLSLAEKRRELARQTKQDIQMKSGRRGKTVKAPIGRSKWRILPSWKGVDDPSVGVAFGRHFVVDMAGDLVAIHMCLDKTYGKRCPICDALKTAIKTSNDKTQKILEEARSSGSNMTAPAY